MNVNMDLIGKFLTMLIVVAILAGIVFLIWTAIFIPIVKRNSLEKQIDQEKKDLLQIQVQKGVEWDNYKHLTEENDKLRKAYFKEKELRETTQKDLAKEQTQKDTLVRKNRELQKGQKS